MIFPVPRRSEPAQPTTAPGDEPASRAELLLWRYRLDRLMELGFDFEDSDTMIPALSQNGLDWHYVKEKLLDRGCSLTNAKLIVLGSD